MVLQKFTNSGDKFSHSRNLVGNCYDILVGVLKIVISKITL